MLRGVSRLHAEAPVEHLTHFQRRVLLDAMLDGWAVTWERAARRYEAARPRPGDFHGKADREALRAKWHELTEIARACRARAQVAPLDLCADLDAVLEEAS